MASTVIGKLIAVLTAQTQPYEAALGKAANSTRAFSRSVADQGARLNEMTMGLRRTFGPEVSIAIDKIVGSMESLKASMTRLQQATAITKGALLGLQIVAVNLVSELKTHEMFLNLNREAVGKYGKAVRKSSEDVSDSVRRHKEFIQQLESLTATYLKLIETPMEKFQKQQAEIIGLFELGYITAEQYDRILQAITEEYEKASGALDAYNDKLREAQRIFDDTRTPLEKYEETLRHLHELYEEGFLDKDTLERALRQAEEVLAEAMKEKLPKVKEPKEAQTSDFKEVQLNRIALDAITPQQGTILSINQRMAALLKQIEANQHKPTLLQFN